MNNNDILTLYVLYDMLKKYHNYGIVLHDHNLYKVQNLYSLFGLIKGQSVHFYLDLISFYQLKLSKTLCDYQHVIPLAYLQFQLSALGYFSFFVCGIIKYTLIFQLERKIQVLV